MAAAPAPSAAAASPAPPRQSPGPERQPAPPPYAPLQAGVGRVGAKPISAFALAAKVLWSFLTRLFRR
jgi:hypothetical protein